MNQQLVAARLAARYGTKVRVGNVRRIEDVRDEKTGRIVDQIAHVQENVFERDDGGDVDPAHVAEETAAVLRDHPQGRAPRAKSPLESKLEMLEAKIAALEAKGVRA